jgi:precorrin-8X/cobalt-precorrin-8 methylmutase
VAGSPEEAGSYRILRSRIDLSRLGPLSRCVTEGVIAASADFDYATDLVCDEQVLSAAVAGLAAGTAVVADTAMVAAGIPGYPVTCKSQEPLTERLSRTAAISKPAAAVRLAFGQVGPGAIWVVGCEPAALDEIMTRNVQPSLVIGLPAGLAGAAEAKDALRASGLPALTNVSEKGGAAVAAAAFCALALAAEAVADPVGGPSARN